MTAEFDDGKEDGALRTIGEVAKALDIKQHVLRYWEQQFPQLEPLKRSGGRRYYRPDDVALVEEIDRLVNGEGYTLKGAQKALSGKGKLPAGSSEADADTKAKPAAVHENDTPQTSDDDMRTTDNGGVDAFFGRTKPQLEARSAPASEETMPDADSGRSDGVPKELVAELKSIRDRLAAAIGS